MGPARQKQDAVCDAERQAPDAGSLSAGRLIDRRDLRFLAVIVVVAFGLRLAYLREIVHLPEFEIPAADAGYHDYWAWGLASGDWTPPRQYEDPRITSTPYFRPPLCPYFLAVLYRLFGHDYLAVRVVQMLLGSLSCALAYLLARRLFDRAAAVVSGFGMAAYWTFIYFDAELREVVLLVFLHLVLLPGLLALRRRPGVWRGAGCGVVLGLAALGRANDLLLLPLVLFWLLLVDRGRPPLRRRVGAAVALAVAAGGVIAAATVRNLTVAGEPVLISSNGGINLYVGNNELAMGYTVRLAPPLPEFATAFDYPAIVRAVEQFEGRSLAHAEVSRWFANRALDAVRAEPLRVAGLMARKAVLFWGGVEIPSERDLNACRAESSLLGVLPGGFALLVSCGAVGVVYALGRRKVTAGEGVPAEGSAVPAAADRWDVALVLLVAAVYFVSFLPFFVTARFRVPITPIVLIFAAYGVVRTLKTLRSQRVWAGVGCVAAILVLYALARVDYYSVAEDGFKARYDRALAYARDGRLEEAVAGYRQALAVRPGSARTHNNLGIALAELGRRDEAIAHYREALRLRPDFAEVHTNLGAELFQAGEIEAAAGHHAEAVRLRPDFGQARWNLALALTVLGRDEQAIREYREVLRLLPDYAGAHHNLGIVLTRQGRLAEAAAEFREVLRLDPDNAKARELLAAVSAELNRGPQP